MEKSKSSYNNIPLAPETEVNNQSSDTSIKYEMEDVVFRRSSTVFMPDLLISESNRRSDSLANNQSSVSGIMVLKNILQAISQADEKCILITGHTDTSGSAHFNRELSLKRAQSVEYMLTGKVQEWINIASVYHNKRDIQHILLWVSNTRQWDTHPGVIDGKLGPKTGKALRNFHRTCETLGLSLPNSLFLCNETWEGVFALYQHELARLLEGNGNSLDYFRNQISWAIASQPSIGCGENHPFAKSEKRKNPNLSDARAEILLFSPQFLHLLQAKLPCYTDNKCKPTHCILYPESRKEREYIDPLCNLQRKSSPLFLTTAYPDSHDYVPIDSLIGYLVKFDDDGNVQSAERYKLKQGKLISFYTLETVEIDCNQEVYIYFSHRDDLLYLDYGKWLRPNREGLPLIGPVNIPSADNAEIKLTIWNQNDWIIIRDKAPDNDRNEKVKMAEWNNFYTIGNASGEYFYTTGDQRKKDFQESWRGGSPLDLIYFNIPDSNDKGFWAGTLSALPCDTTKIIFTQTIENDRERFIGSINEIKLQGTNQFFQNFHIYNGQLVDKLVAISRNRPRKSEIDDLPEPPEKANLPGDMCWQDQGNTNNCGPYSFSSAMNYWFPYTNNPYKNDGALYADEKNVNDLVNGARVPSNIIRAAERFHMHGRDNTAERIDKKRALKLLKLWIHAGVPVLVLVKEYHTLASYHWKVVAGYDKERIFFNNSGADNEYKKANQQAEIDYMHAPVGNDVDSIDDHYEKWHGAGGDIVDLLTSVDRDTFIPIYPKDINYRGDMAV